MPYTTPPELLYHNMNEATLVVLNHMQQPALWQMYAEIAGTEFAQIYNNPDYEGETMVEVTENMRYWIDCNIIDQPAIQCNPSLNDEATINAAIQTLVTGAFARVRLEQVVLMLAGHQQDAASQKPHFEPEISGMSNYTTCSLALVLENTRNVLEDIRTFHNDDGIAGIVDLQYEIRKWMHAARGNGARIAWMQLAKALMWAGYNRINWPELFDYLTIR